MTDALRLSIAEIAERTDTSQKTIRAYLRSHHARSQEQKNARWGNAKQGYALSAKLTSELLDRYTSHDDNANDNS